MKNAIRAGQIRLLLTLATLASLAIVIEAGHRW
jgi:hypothetical protein